MSRNQSAAWGRSFIMSRRTSRARYVLWWMFAAIFAAGLPACYFLFTHGFLSLFNEWIKAQGAVGVFAFATAYVVVSVLLLAPAELISVAAGVVFGVWGAPLVAISAVIAAIIAFLLSRYLFRAKVKGLVANRPLLRAIDAAIGAQSWQIAVLLRLNPLVGFNFQNYFLGATNIELIPYAVTTAFGILPLATMYVYLGTVGRTIATEQDLGPSKTAFLVVGLVLTVAMIYIVGRKTKQKLQEMSAAAGCSTAG
jgi:uncharacterized membrane protein YdjX (TVP38/TMEM64 family)